MSAEPEKIAKANGDAAPRPGVETSAFGKKQWRQVAWITLGALALYLGFRALPTGTNLNHIDFRTGETPGSLEMCDPSNPQFIPVMAVRSPVSLKVQTTGAAPAAGREFRGVARLTTASGKRIGPVDLLVMHTRRLHLLVVDPSLSDYQHLHPEAGEREGEWVFAFTPQREGVYRVFADFTPVATGRGLYAGADLLVGGEAGAAAAMGESNVGASHVVKRDGFVFSLTIAGGKLAAGKVADLAFAIERADGGEVPLQPVMDAYAHLVAFDEARSGFAHLHPNESDLSKKPDARTPRLTFKITIPQRGRYVIWAQVNVAGQETFVPFPVEVL